MIALVVWVQLAATLMLCGLIWVIQVVHYPLMEHVDEGRFREFHAWHTRRISWLVVPLMMVELGAAAVLLWRCPPGVPPVLPVTGAMLVVVIWSSTFGLQVPRHRELAGGWNPRAHRCLVRSNWIRTWAWTLRSAIALTIAVVTARSVAP